MKLEPFDILQEVRAARERIRPFIRQTILEPSPYYSQLTGAGVFFKCENLQHTGSFKARGALNVLLSLTDGERVQGIVTASTGNHGAAVAYALRLVPARGIVFVPEKAEPSKIAKIELLGAEVRYFGQDSAEAEAYARQFATQEGMTYVSPYNDPHIISGQGTIALELQEQLAEIDAVFISLGGGGLISGIAGVLKEGGSPAEVLGCSPANSQVMIQSIAAGEILDLPSLPTLSDGTAGGVEPGSITFDLCQRWVDEYVTVTEEEIAAALRQFMAAQQMMIEGSAAVAIASFLKVHERYQGKNVVIVLCGANIGVNTLREVLTA